MSILVVYAYLLHMSGIDLGHIHEQPENTDIALYYTVLYIGSQENDLYLETQE